jgi:hypothetical protein
MSDIPDMSDTWSLYGLYDKPNKPYTADPINPRASFAGSWDQDGQDPALGRQRRAQAKSGAGQYGTLNKPNTKTTINPI